MDPKVLTNYNKISISINNLNRIQNMKMSNTMKYNKCIQMQLIW
jgi:ribosomal protein S2